MLLDLSCDKLYYEPLIYRNKYEIIKFTSKRLWTIFEVIEWHVRFTMVP